MGIKPTTVHINIIAHWLALLHEIQIPYTYIFLYLFKVENGVSPLLLGFLWLTIISIDIVSKIT